MRRYLPPIVNPAHRESNMSDTLAAVARETQARPDRVAAPPLRILHVLDHSLPLHSGYTFRTLSILAHQRRLGW